MLKESLVLNFRTDRLIFSDALLYYGFVIKRRYFNKYSSREGTAMADSFQNEVPKARINLKLALHTGGVQKKVELPLKLLTLGDFSNGKEDRPLSEREKININKNNFNSVLAEFNPEINLTVQNTLAGEGTEESIMLNFADMKDFEPEQVARQIPQLRAMLAMRNLLRDLKSNLLDNATFRKELEKILKDPALSQELRDEMSALARNKRRVLFNGLTGNMLMSVNTETASAQGQTAVLEKEGVYASLFEKINLTPASRLGDINDFLDDAALSDAPAGERLTAAMQVFMDCIRKAGQPVEKLDKTLIDHHIAELDYQISRQLDAIMHHEAFQKVESLWRGLKQLVDSTDYSQNVKTEILDVSKDDLRQDFEDAPELIQSGLYWHTYTAEYDTPGGEPIGSVISAYEFDASPQDVALLRNISNVSAAAHMPFIGAVGPAFFLKDSMEEVAAIKDIGNYFDRAEYIKWKSFRDTDDARYIGLVMPRVLGRLPYGPDTVPVRSFNYVEQVKGPDHEKYLWTSASFSFAANMVKSFINNGWCVQIRGPQAGGAVKDLPIHLYDLGTGNQVKIPSEVMIPETREFEFAGLGFIPLSFYKNRDYACFFSANSAQKPARYDTADATANSRINARLPYIFLLSRIAHYLKLIQRENIGTTKDRRLLELELNTWVRGLVTEMTDPGDELQASHPLRDAKVVVEDIEDNPGFFRVKLFAVPHFQVEGMDVNLSLVSQMPKAKS